MKDAAWRTLYRVGFALARQWWRLRHPYHAGALVAVWCDGRVLAVRQTYRRELTLPGGGLNTGEAAATAASRELHEELGLTADPAALRLAWEQMSEWDYRRDHVRIFELVLPAEPQLRPDRREISEAMFLSPAEFMANKVSPTLRDYLASVRTARPPQVTVPAAASR